MKYTEYGTDLYKKVKKNKIDVFEDTMWWADDFLSYLHHFIKKMINRHISIIFNIK